ncbi:Bug family tripartite tricarboxylate transporter substrate binding protein [Zwartia vadi]|uniref:Bug family tripartite tricarboxylate transporter substrate binding protein n=1 Tax=Zwartia vadi TaxID=3058168 RepID=UPI0025B5A36E|nr:tripartite tricarboxylate transporter substrate binding protein [Zwartia vadi]MDN3987611.1 tripartite tricarboxylate transporter substrate binding protein [Zwartia vadi]
MKMNGFNLKKICASVLLLTGVSLNASLSHAQTADNYPSKTIKLVVPFAPGGVTDTSGRILAEGLSKRLGQQVVVENKPGASGNIGAQMVATSPADGYTLFLALDGTLVINPHAYSKIGFDTIKDFAPVAKIGNSVIILAANPAVKAKNLKELVALANATPGGLSYGTSGNASIVHLAGELLKQQSNSNFVHVAYKGGGPAVADALAGHIPLTFASAASINQHLKAGKLVALGVPSATRSAAYPDIPTFKESGIPGIELNSWVGIMAPAKTPANIIEKLNKEINAVLQDPAVKAKLLGSGIEASNVTPAQFGQEIQRDLEMYKPVVEKAGIKVN